MANFDDYMRVVLVIKEVFVYKIPPRQSNRAVKAADWGLSNPDFTGRLRVLVINDKLWINVEDQSSGKLFARSLVSEWPSQSLEPVSDSSRYFILRLTADDGRHAFVGIGFGDRGDSFDLNVTLQEHFKQSKAEKEQEQVNSGEVIDDTPKLDLALKTGQSIKINLGIKHGKITNTNCPNTTPKINAIKQNSLGSLTPALFSGLLPPPPSKNINSVNIDFSDNQNSPNNTPQSSPFGTDFINSNNITSKSSKSKSDDFGDFGSSTTDSWVQF